MSRVGLLGPGYLGHVVPHVRHSVNSLFSQRHKRVITERERFFAIAFPSYDVCKIAREVMHIADSLEILANSTVKSLELNGGRVA